MLKFCRISPLYRLAGQWTARALMLGVAAMWFSGCGRRAKPVVEARLPLLSGHAAAQGETAFLRSQHAAPIEWKAATPEVFAFAAAQRAMVLMVLGSHMDSSSEDLLRLLQGDSGLVERVRRGFVPVLVDIDQQREYGLLAMDLATRVKQQLNFPVMVWMTAAGDPVTWLVFPAQATSARNLQIMKNGLDLVERTWRENPDYVESNSKADNQVWAESSKRYNEPSASVSDERRAALDQAVKSLLQLHDSVANQLDGLGSRLPVDYLDALMADQTLSQRSAATAQRTREVLNDSLNALMASAAVDAVDGGFYRTRLASDWSVVMPWRDGLTQAQAIWTYATTGKGLARADCLETAKRALAFHRRTFACESGLYALVSQRAQLPMERVYWNVAELEREMSPSAWDCLFTRAALRERGNISPENDPRQQFYRLNSLVPQLSFAQVAQRLRCSEVEAARNWQEAMEAVQRRRDREVGASSPALSADFATSVSTISAYLALHVAVTEGDYLAQARALWSSLEQQFLDQGCWYLESKKNAGSLRLRARAGDLALLLRTVLDFHDATLDPIWLQRARAVMALMESHVLDQRWCEEPVTQRVLAQAVVDGRMVFGSSTVGMMKQNAERWRLLEQELSPVMQRAMSIQLRELVDFPAIHSDYLFGLLIEDDGLKVGVPVDVLPATREAVLRLPLRVVTRCAIPANGGNLVLWRGGKKITDAASVSMIESLLHP